MKRITVIVALLLVLSGAGTVGIHWLTGRTWLESAYLAVITLTTVGSEDVPNKDPRAMLFIMGYLVCGLGIFSYSAFQIGAAVVDLQLRRILEKRRMEKSIDALHDHFVICGLGRMGTTMCMHLAARKQPFVVIDHDELRLQHVARERGWMCLHGDATDDQVLTAAGTDRARSVATVLPTDADNVYVVLSVHMLAPNVPIIARASDDAAMKKLLRAGASRVVSPFTSGAVKMARFMLNPSIEDFLEVADEHGSDLELADVLISETSPYVGKQLAQTDLRQRGVMVIGIRRANGERLLPPPGNAVIEPGDSLFAFGSAAAVNAMISRQE